MVGENAAAAGGGGMMKWLLLFSGIALVSITAYGIYGPEVDNSPKILDVCVETRFNKSLSSLALY